MNFHSSSILRRLPAALVIVLALSSCTDDESDINLQTKVEQTLTASTWGVSLFFDGDNETEKFAGYTLGFNDDGTLSANGSHAGAWMTSVHGRNGASVVITFAHDNTLFELNDTWRVIECRSDFVRLEDVGGGPGEINKINKLALERTGPR